MVAWRLRFVTGAACLGLAAAVAVSVLRPAPPVGVDVLVAAHDLAAGVVVADGDVRAVTVPEAVAVSGALASDRTRAALVGRRTAVRVPAGLPLVPQVLAGADLAGPTGTVVAAVRLADDAMASLLAPGDRVDLLAAAGEGGPAVTVARGALVLPAAPRTEGSGPLGLDSPASPALLVAVAPDEAAALAGAGVSTALFAVVVP
jgi:pilus assembly protein CpaB